MTRKYLHVCDIWYKNQNQINAKIGIDSYNIFRKNKKKEIVVVAFLMYIKNTFARENMLSFFKSLGRTISCIKERTKFSISSHVSLA